MSARRLATLWPARLLVAVLAFGLLGATAPRLIVHAHADVVAGQHHEPAHQHAGLPSDSDDPGIPHVHDACGVAALAIASLPSAFAGRSTPERIAEVGVATIPATLPNFLHRPPIA